MNWRPPLPTEISLIHATRGRPGLCNEVRTTWLERAVDPTQVEHIFAVDEDDHDTMACTARYGRVVLPPDKGCFVAFNAAARESVGRLIVPIEDDLWPQKGWDLQCIEAMAGMLDEVAVLSVCDGFNAVIENSITRRFFEERGFYHEGYFGLCGDNEFREKLRRDGVPRIEARHILFDHRHYQRGQAPNDETYQRKQGDHRVADLRLFGERQSAGWP